MGILITLVEVALVALFLYGIISTGISLIFDEIDKTVFTYESDKRRVEDTKKQAKRISLYVAITVAVVSTYISVSRANIRDAENKYFFFAGVQAVFDNGHLPKSEYQGAYIDAQAEVEAAREEYIESAWERVERRSFWY